MKFTHKLLIAYIRIRLKIVSLYSKKEAARQAFKIFCTPYRRPKRREPSIFASGERLSFRINDLTVRGLRWNHPQQKKILIVHGFESASKNFGRYINSFIQKGYEVLAFDAPAHGRSSGKQINLILYLETLQKIDQLYGPVDGFVAHSYGALIVAHLLEKDSGNQERKAAFIAPATETSSTVNSFFRFLRLGDGVRKEFERLIFDLSGNWPAHFSIRRAMHHTNAQVIWFHDKEDDMTPVEDALRVRDDAHPHIQFVITQGLGHRRIYRNEEVIKKVVDFF